MPTPYRRWGPGWLVATLASGARQRTVVECATPQEARNLRYAMYRRKRKCSVSIVGRNIVLTPLAEPTIKSIPEEDSL